MSALAGVCRISARFAGRLRYGGSIFVSMSAGKLRNSFFLRKAAESTGEFHHTRRLISRFLGNLSLAEGVLLGIQPDVASIAAQRPVLILIVLNFT